VATTAVASASARGTVEIDAGELLVANGGRIDASTFIADQGGSIDVTASDSIVIAGTGSGIASRTGAQGKGGNLTLSAPRIEVKDGGGGPPALVVASLPSPLLAHGACP
jgi:large exoprotein involved in heme utilization and adhesion